MKHLILLLPIALLTGCASPTKIARSYYEIEIPTAAGPRKVRIETFKDFDIERLVVRAANGEEFDLSGLKTTVDKNAAEVAKIQAQSQGDQMRGFLDLMKENAATLKLVGEGYAKSQGVPMPQQAQPAQPQVIKPFNPVPYTYKTNDVGVWLVPNSNAGPNVQPLGGGK